MGTSDLIICRPWVQLSEFEFGRHDFKNFNHGFSDPWMIVFVPRPKGHPYYGADDEKGYMWSIRVGLSWGPKPTPTAMSLEEAKTAADTMAVKLDYQLLSEEDMEKVEMLK